jgi:hypothetical protein
VIHEVDESLRELVRRDVLNGAGVELSFDAPSKDWSARRTAPTLNLYLYDIHEDLTRRQVQFEEIRDSEGKVVGRIMPPRRFKLSYLVTAWTQRSEDEHRLLSALLSCFIRSDALPRDVLQGALADQPDAVRCTIALPLPPERSISDVWSALGGEMKPSLDLVITAPFVTGRSLPVGPPVTEEPSVRVGPTGGTMEEAGRRPSPTPPGDGGSAEGEDVPPAVESITETVVSGRKKAGRRLDMRSMPKP